MISTDYYGLYVPLLYCELQVFCLILSHLVDLFIEINLGHRLVGLFSIYGS